MISACLRLACANLSERQCDSDMHRKTLLVSALIVGCAAAIVVVAWPKRTVALTQQQHDWIAATQRGPVDALPETDTGWKEVLAGEAYRVLREEETERAFENEFWNAKTEGLYRCAGCGEGLFSSTDKFKSGTGWPSFTRPVADEQISQIEQHGLFGNRTEITCSRCDGHLGHMFDDGPRPRELRYCINSSALRFDDSVSQESTARSTE